MESVSIETTVLSYLVALPLKTRSSQGINKQRTIGGIDAESLFTASFPRS